MSDVFFPLSGLSNCRSARGRSPRDGSAGVALPTWNLQASRQKHAVTVVGKRRW